MTLHELNTLPAQQLKEELLKCCGSSSWVKMMLAYFPADDLVELLEGAEEVWYKCSQDDWKEAFAHHPRIGNVESLSEGPQGLLGKLLSEKEKFASTAKWASDEQSGVNTASQETIEALAEANKLYEKKFGYIFIVCATGRSAAEMLGLLRERLSNNPVTEIEIAADEQNKITKLRLEKLLE